MNQSNQQLARHRLRSISGHLKHVEKMVDEDQYCVDIMRQIQAVQAALSKVNALILEDHLHHCVTAAVRGEDADQRERVLREIMEVYQFVNP
jgi:DNA-binding FrmR family transcriptional regulator